MAQGKLKVKSKLPDNVKNKKNKGKAVTKRSNRPIQPKKTKLAEANKIKKVISKTVNKAVEDEIRNRAFGEKATLSKAQQAVADHNKTKKS